MESLRAYGCLCFCVLWTGWLSAQYVRFDASTYQSRDSLIAGYVHEEDYKKALPLIEAQLDYLVKSNRTDSLFRYVYKVGRTVWRTQDAEAGILRTEQLIDLVLATDTHRLHHLQVYEDLSWVYYETGRNDLCIQADERYLKICKGMPHATPRQRSVAYYNLGFDYMTLGNWKEAVAYFENSIPPLLQAEVYEVKRLVNCYNALGAARQRIGDFDSAKKAFDVCLAHIDSLSEADDRLINTSNVLGNLALIYEQEGDFVSAKNHVQKAMETRKEWLKLDHEPWELDQQKKLLASNYHNLGVLYFKMGDYSRARQLLLYERSYKKQILEPGHPDYDKTFETFGSLQVALGEYDSAFVNLSIYRDACLKHFGRKSYFTGNAYQRLAKINLLRGSYQEALESYGEAIYIFTVISDEDTGQELAESHLRRAEVYGHLGALDKASADIEVAIAIYAESGNASADVNRGMAFLAKANLLHKFGLQPDALIAVDTAIANLSESHRNLPTNGNRKAVQLAPYLPDAYHTRAAILRKHKPGAHGRREALEALDYAIDILRDKKRAFDADEAQLYLYEDHAGVFQMALALRFEQFVEEKSKAALERIFALTEESRAILLRRQLTGFSSLKLANIPDSLPAQERKYIAQLTGRRPLDGDYFEVEKTYEALQNYIKKQYPAYYELRFEEKVATTAQLQQEWLQPGSNLIRYVVLDSLAFAICISRNSMDAIALNLAGLGEDIHALNTAILAGDGPAYQRTAISLHQALVAPLLPHIQGDELFIIPDKELFGLNFEALIDPVSGASLLEHFTISYLHSATTALQFGSLSGKTGSGALAFAPGFSDEVKALYAASVKDSSIFDPHYMMRIQQPFAVNTANKVSTLFAGKAYTGAGATEQRFKDEAGQFGIIHLGTHTEINNLSPMLSRLVLTKTPGEEEDGYLHAYEIYNLDLHAELAVLTACETGVGKNVESEGILSLAHSFAYAGVPSIVMSLWQIDEKTSAVVVEDFYRLMAKGMPKNQALRQAKLNYIKANPGELSAPYYWSGLVLIGDVHPVQIHSGTQQWWPYMPVVLLLSLIAIWAYRKRTKSKLRLTGTEMETGG
jgi:CHAT domain-containing protein